MAKKNEAKKKFEQMKAQFEKELADKARALAEALKEVRQEEVDNLPKPVKFSMDQLVKARPDLSSFKNELEKVFKELSDSGMQFDKVDRVKGSCTGSMKKYKLEATFKVADDIFPKKTVVMEVHNIADDNPLEHTWASFVWPKSHTPYENRLLDYIVGDAYNGPEPEEE
jgi:translation initiation factor 2B subunit (eIF-2B alpha/beta/delta family)